MRRGLVVTAVMVLGVAGPLMAQAPGAGDEDQAKARQRISTMEGVLERAVLNGADNLLRKARSVTQDYPTLSGVPEVRGFRLEGYGVVFDVEVPALRLPITWMLRVPVVENNQVVSSVLQELRAALLAAQITGRDFERIEQLLRRLEVGNRSAYPARASAGPGFQPSGGPPVPPAAPDIISDPNNAYTSEVKGALIDAMLENSTPLTIGDEEWLTVAARDNVPSNPLVPGDTADFTTVIFRIKGSDLAAFHARRVTLEESRKRVEVREY